MKLWGLVAAGKGDRAVSTAFTAKGNEADLDISIGTWELGFNSLQG